MLVKTKFFGEVEIDGGGQIRILRIEVEEALRPAHGLLVSGAFIGVHHHAGELRQLLLRGHIPARIQTAAEAQKRVFIRGALRILAERPHRELFLRIFIGNGDRRGLRRGSGSSR